MPGHIFVTRTDIRKLSCDAWVMSADHTCASYFFDHAAHCEWLKYIFKQLKCAPSDLHKLPDQLRPKLQPMEGAENIWEIDLPRRYFANFPLLFAVGVTAMADSNKPEEIFLTKLLIKALEIIASRLLTDKREMKLGRSKYLLAVPVVGTGEGGAAYSTGVVVRQLLDSLLEFCRKYVDFDLVLCTRDKATFNVAQNHRLSKLHEFWEGSFVSKDSEFGEEYYKLQDIDRLADLAVQGKLVLFIGAGVCLGAGLPTWNGLLEELAHEVNIDVESDDWKSIDYLTKADIIEKRLCSGGNGTVGDWIAQRMDIGTYSLQHSLLAALKCKTVVTTNYDRCYENAFHSMKLSDSPADKISVIPIKIRKNSNFSLLKMHGCISKPEDIVLTRKHHIRYMESNVALAGIVQTSLLTSHMLFVGFSLADENFHKIMDSVVKAKKYFSNDALLPFATSLQLFKNEFVQELWNPEIMAIPMRPQSAKNSYFHEWSEAGRDVEIFLDLLLVRRNNIACSYLLDARFHCFLSDEEKILKDALDTLVNDITTEQGVPLPPLLQSYLESYGFEDSFLSQIKISQI